MGSNLINLSKDIAEKCIECPLCRRECAFLAKYGNPKEIASRIDPQDDATLALAYECSLCGLCGAVCPVDLDPWDLFLEMRRAAVSKGIAPFPEHKMLLDYEKRGTSETYSYYALPEGCQTDFFPGLRSSRHPAEADPSGVSSPAFFHPRPGDRPGLLHQTFP